MLKIRKLAVNTICRSNTKNQIPPTVVLESPLSIPAKNYYRLTKMDVLRGKVTKTIIRLNPDTKIKVFKVDKDFQMRIFFSLRMSIIHEYCDFSGTSRIEIQHYVYLANIILVAGYVHGFFLKLHRIKKGLCQLQNKKVVI